MSASIEARRHLPFALIAFDSLVYLMAFLTLFAAISQFNWVLLSPVVLSFTTIAIFREFRRTSSGYFFFLRLLLIFTPLVQLAILGPSRAFDVLGHTQDLFNRYGYDAVTLVVSFYLFLEIGRTVLGIERKCARMEVDLLTHAQLETSVFGQYLLSIICLIALVIYQPSLPGLSYSELVHNLLPGSGWNFVCLISYGALLLNRHRTRLAAWVIWIVPIWLLVHYDRGELLGIMIFYYLSVRADGKSLRMQEKLIGVILIVSFIIVGLIRNEPSLEALGQMGMDGIVGNRTLQDSTHNLLAALVFFDTQGALSTIRSTFEYLIPSYLTGERPVTAEAALHSRISTHHGVHWIGEIYLNGGYLAAVAGALITSTLVPAMLYVAQYTKDRILCSLLIFHIFLTLPRFCWYGIIYLLKPLILIVPVVWLIATLTSIRNHSTDA